MVAVHAAVVGHAHLVAVVDDDGAGEQQGRHHHQLVLEEGNAGVAWKKEMRDL